MTLGRCTSFCSCCPKSRSRSRLTTLQPSTRRSETSAILCMLCTPLVRSPFLTPVYQFLSCVLLLSSTSSTLPRKLCKKKRGSQRRAWSTSRTYASQLYLPAPVAPFGSVLKRTHHKEAPKDHKRVLPHTKHAPTIPEGVANAGPLVIKGSRSSALGWASWSSRTILCLTVEVCGWTAENIDVDESDCEPVSGTEQHGAVGSEICAWTWARSRGPLSRFYSSQLGRGLPQLQPFTEVV